MKRAYKTFPYIVEKVITDLEEYIALCSLTNGRFADGVNDTIFPSVSIPYEPLHAMVYNTTRKMRACIKLVDFL